MSMTCGTCCSGADPGGWTSGGRPIGYEPVFEDPAAAHQIVIRRASRGSAVTVSCTCLPGALIETRSSYPDGPLAAWRAWHEREGAVA
jgi:hypothetical protein